VAGRRSSYFERHAAWPTRRLDEIVALQRGVIGRHLHLVASSSYPFDSVLRALAEPSFVLGIEGMPKDRYLPGASVMDVVEEEGEQLVIDLFGQPAGYRATLQPHSATQANQIVYNASLGPEDTVLSMRPRDGGHISHTVLLSRRHTPIYFGLTADGLIDYDEMAALALQHRPRLIIVGGSSIPRAIDFARCGEIARTVGALLHADVSHTATFIAAGIHPTMFPHCDFATFNTMKNLRGPNGGILIYRDAVASQVHRSIFPTTQGGANESGMMAKYACLLEWDLRGIEPYARSVVSIARLMGDRLVAAGIPLVTGGTDCHLLLLDLRSFEMTGAEAEHALEALGVLANRNQVPDDPRSPQQTSGLRIGAANLAILGYQPADARALAAWLADVVTGGPQDRTVVDALVDTYQAHLVAPVW
jgi:glycine hydroxymethyltransferase